MTENKDKKRGKGQKKQCETCANGFMARLRILFEHNRLGELMVLSGNLSPDALDQALSAQKSERGSLGDILIRRKMVSRKTLYGALVKQWSLRGLMAMAALFLFVSSVGVKQARAGSIKDIPHQIHLAQDANAAFMPVSSYPALFGHEERRSRDISAFTKWSEMFARFDVGIEQAANEPEIRKWRAELTSYQGLALPEMVRKVNALVNAQPYIVDSRNWGKSDYWETPVEFFARGGDCEDFAIAKYVSLRLLGVPEERLRIAIVHDEVKDIPHALLIVYTDEGAMILDNQVQDARFAEAVTRYRPIFSINRQAWWLHTKPKSTVLASAR